MNFLFLALRTINVRLDWYLVCYGCIKMFVQNVCTILIFHENYLIFTLISVSIFQADLNCRNTKQAVGSIFTRTNFVTLRYVTDGWGTDSNGFTLVVTAVKDQSKTIHSTVVIAQQKELFRLGDVAAVLLLIVNGFI